MKLTDEEIQKIFPVIMRYLHLSTMARDMKQWCEAMDNIRDFAGYEKLWDQWASEPRSPLPDIDKQFMRMALGQLYSVVSHTIMVQRIERYAKQEVIWNDLEHDDFLFIQRIDPYCMRYIHGATQVLESRLNRYQRKMLPKMDERVDVLKELNLPEEFLIVARLFIDIVNDRRSVRSVRYQRAIEELSTIL